MKKQRVFQLGLFKTGTSSTAKALRMLGYLDGQGVANYDRGLTDADYIKAMDDQNDEQNMARRGFPWNHFYPYLSEKYPDAKFILTLRDEDDWLRSVKIAWGNDLVAIHDWFFQCEGIVDDIYIQRFREHNHRIIEFFKDMPDRLLVIRVVDGEGWEKLAPFMGIETPKEPFPWINKTRDNHG